MKVANASHTDSSAVLGSGLLGAGNGTGFWMIEIGTLPFLSEEGNGFSSVSLKFAVRETDDICDTDLLTLKSLSGFAQYIE